MSEDFKEFVTFLIGAVMLVLAAMACILAGRATYLLFNLDTVCKSAHVEASSNDNP